jgi:hypothetical protein
VHELRRRPVGQLGIEDLRVLVAQRVGLDVLVPLALARLEENPLAEGDFYPGDLLVAVLRVPPAYWQSRPERRPGCVRSRVGRPGRTGPGDRGRTSWRFGATAADVRA